jgi:demethylmenaquinone methyltransferase/2-methoxy-6-polyprenyl-1,4-benzoquinol methylase
LILERRSLPGTRPRGTASEGEAAQHVREMFSRIAPRYDLLNHLLSLDMDRIWRRRVARRFRSLLSREGARALDLCCGTGDLAIALRRPGRSRVYGADFAHPMLVRAVAKVPTRGRDGVKSSAPGNASYIEADALRLPFADATFDLVASAFGFRNLANYQQGLREIFRVLKPGGSLAILEFSEPRSPLLGALYRWYFRSVLPRIGAAVSGDGGAYSYLPASVSRFPLVQELADQMEQAGFSEVRFELWTGGIVTLHTAVRPRT